MNRLVPALLLTALCLTSTDSLARGGFSSGGGRGGFSGGVDRSYVLPSRSSGMSSRCPCSTPRTTTTVTRNTTINRSSGGVNGLPPDDVSRHGA